MAFLRQYVVPFLIFLVFLVALFATSSRIFLPADMMAPAPTEDVDLAGFNPLQKSTAATPEASQATASDGELENMQEEISEEIPALE